MVQIRVKPESDDDDERAPFIHHDTQERPKAASTATNWVMSFLHLLTGIYTFLEQLCTGLGVLISLLRSEGRSLDKYVCYYLSAELTFQLVLF